MNKIYRAKVSLWIELEAENSSDAIDAYDDIIEVIRANSCDEEYRILDTDIEYYGPVSNKDKIDNPNVPNLQDLEDFWNDK